MSDEGGENNEVGIDDGRSPGWKRKAFAVIFLTIFLDLVGFGIIIPIQPFYAEAFGARPAVVTLLGASYSLAQFIMLPVWGRLSDRYGRRPILLSSIMVAIIGYTLFGLAGSLGALFGARILAGVGTANIATAQAVIADLTTAKDRASGMALIGIAFGLGFVVGPAIGGIFAQYGLATPAFIAAGLSAVNLVSAAFLVPETLPKHLRGQGRTDTRAFRAGRIARALRVPNLGQMLVIYFMVTLGFALMEQTLPLFIEHVFVPAGAAFPTDPFAASLLGLDAGDAFDRETSAAALTTWLLVVVGITAIVVQGGLIRVLVRIAGERMLLVVGLAIEALALACFPFAGWQVSFLALLIGSGVLAVGSGLYNPSASALLSLSAPEDIQGSTLGLGQSMSALGRVLGPAMAGLIFEWNTDVPFFLAAVLILMMSGLGLTLKMPDKAAPSS